MRWPLTFITDRFVPANAGACVRVILLPIIFIRPKYCDDVGIYRHELEHVKQAWLCVFPPIHALFYLLDRNYRLHCEVEAYREQAKHYSDDRHPLFARFISEGYGLGIAPIEALRLLKQ